MRSKRGAAWLAMFLLALAAETGYCFLHPVAYFDTLAYVSLQHRSGGVAGGGNDFGRIGQSCAAALPGTYTGCDAVTSSEVFQQAAALSPSEYPVFLRFYTVKPLYLLLARVFAMALHVDGWQALRYVSASSFALIGLLCFFWLRRMTGPATAMAGAVCLMSLPGTVALGKGLLPDGLLTALILLGAFLLTRRHRWMAAAVLLLATLVRADALLFAVGASTVLIWQGSPTRLTRLLRLCGLLIAAALWDWGLQRFTGALPWRVLFVHSFLAWTPPAGYGSLHVNLHDYLRVLRSNGMRTVLFCLPLPLLLALLALVGRRRSTAPRNLEPMNLEPMNLEPRNLEPGNLVVAALLAVAIRILLYPGVEDRYYVWLTLLAGLDALASVAHRQGAEAE